MVTVLVPWACARAVNVYSPEPSGFPSHDVDPPEMIVRVPPGPDIVTSTPSELPEASTEIFSLVPSAWRTHTAFAGDDAVSSVTRIS